ncbi:MAG TPA: protein kinase [Thermoanaerobaculia bacterium]|nr:protein kinase [Thermoanaerobaculia bacterium]
MREPGSVLDGKYEIMQRLGSGGMGEVYLVRHLHLQELRVVKILRQDLAADPSAQKRFMREARLATQIKHPNVAILYDFSRLEDGSFYRVWEHIEGEDVGDRLRRAGPFPVPLAVQLGVQALHGLEAVHASGVIHRDLSPDNLMLMEGRRGQMNIKIIDLGLARTLEMDANLEITQVGMFMGKLQYCSPEQAGASSGQTLDARSDLYSFALVLYEMITGRPPFDSENQAGFIFKRLSEDPLPLIGRNPQVNVPVELDRVVRRALERDRERRFPDAAAFISALDRVGQGMNAAETREIPVWHPPPAPQQIPRPRSSAELSKAEKNDLLAQIARAAVKRTQESSGDFSRVEEALAAGQLDEAQRLIAQIEAAQPRAAGLDRVREKLAALKGTAEQERRIAETEQVLGQYLQRKQLPLARLALETLAELSPGHPKREDYEARVGLLATEVEQDKRVEAALAAGRAAIARKDFRAARQELENAARNDPAAKRSHIFAQELETAASQARQETSAEEHMRSLEKALAEHRVSDAERDLDELSRLGLARVTFDFYRERVAEARSRNQQQETVARLEWLYRKLLTERDWQGAREAAHELGDAAPESPRAAEMFAEVDRLQAVQRREQAMEQGVKQVETFVEQGDAARAELALKILVQMDPENRHRKRLEKQVKALPRR